ncbi:hypothetical protein N7G274_005522 [Stereocaulon virgatum]|uniref:WD40 repeat-like protein n=1 Tax=Stereocaulon virgatum TaxID=373712 RepID=A0ABR4AEC8_9LECA
MASTNIPGFYYDRVKRKYFKIQPNHIAPTGSAYSTDSVKKDAEDILEAKERAKFEQLERKQIMQRSKVLSYPLGGRLALERETGLQYDSIRRMNEAWVYGIQDRIVLTHNSGHDMGPFVYDKATGGFIFASVLGPIDTGHPIICASPVDPNTTKGDYRLTSGFMMDSDISSLALSKSRVLMATAMGSSRPASLHITKLYDPVGVSSEFETMEADDGAGVANPVLRPDISVMMRFPNCPRITFWACSANPDENRSGFAVATSDGTFLVEERETGYMILRQQSFGPNQVGQGRVTEILALDWLDSNVLLNGCREGMIRLWDVRIPGPESTSLRLRHPSGVNHVRRVNENIIIVAGLYDQLCTYDLRYTPESQTLGSTQPYVTFPKYQNHGHTGLALGFDVCRDVVAAATERCKLALFDVGTGRELISERFEKGNASTPQGVLSRRMRFVEGEGTRGASTPHATTCYASTPHSALSRCVKIVEGEGTRDAMRVMFANGRSIYIS